MASMTRIFTLAIVVSTACADDPMNFGDARLVSAATSVGAAPNVAVSPEGREAVAWISAPDGGTDGRLYISIDGAAPAEIRDSLGPIEAHGESPPKVAYGRDGALHALYVVGRVVPGARFPQAALRYVVSRDGGATWSAPVRVTDDGDFGSHNFHALHVAPNGTVYVAWLDGRAGKSAAYIAWTGDGATWSTNVRVTEGEACPCCRTSIAADTGNVVYLAWRAVLPGNIRDVVVARSSDGGMSWSEPVRAHPDDWRFDGCPHAGPSLAVDSRHRVHIAWWTGKPGAAGVLYARADSGLAFGPAVPIHVAATSRAVHVQLAVRDSLVGVVWDDGIGPRPSVLLRVSQDGGASFSAAERLSDPALVATFPVVTFAASRLRVVWTEEDPDAHARAAASQLDMRDPEAKKGLTPVGKARVVARQSRPE